MSIVVRYAPVPASTVEQYDEVMRRLQESGTMPADGFDYHVAFLSEGQLLVSEVWDSPEQLEPMPCSPRLALCSGLKRKWTRVLWLRDEDMRMSPPWPPSPPEGPPRGTNFSRRKAMQPLPPSPALIRIRASSINISQYSVYKGGWYVPLSGCLDVGVVVEVKAKYGDSLLAAADFAQGPVKATWFCKAATK